MKVLVTGATGFLGSHVAELLVREGHAVKALVRKTSKTGLLEKLGAELHQASLEKGEGLDEAVADVDAVVHAAGLVKARSLDEFLEVNEGGTRNLLEATKRTRPGVERFVYVSSLAAHGFSETPEPRAWDDEPQPLTHYGMSKLEGEKAALEAASDLPVTVIRPPAIYGPRDPESFKLFKMVGMRLKIFLGGADHLISWVYAEDCARAIRDALVREHPSGRVYFVDDGRVYTQAEFAGIIEQALGVKAMSLSLPMGIVSFAALMSEMYGRMSNQAVLLTRNKLQEMKQPYLICHGKEIREELGWQPEVQLEEGARRTVEWYRQNGWL